ncbi:MAG: crossover junction endodeoxyribonuclease RuvC [Candidatus Terrybacteria bacterium]|nr:crossover junction endodeoxyribonuclease RuvC [Candidatus Terrybacteria bacterium]
MIILGIDPGFGRMGCAVLEKSASSADSPKRRETLLYSTCVTTDKKLAHEKRLLALGEKLEKIIKKHKPNVIAVEKLFFFKNQKTIIGVAEAKGMILYLAAKAKIPVLEFTPLEIKMAMTGYGRAEKTQVQKMAIAILNLKKAPKYDDEIDAIACALTCSISVIHRNF